MANKNRSNHSSGCTPFSRAMESLLSTETRAVCYDPVCRVIGDRVDDSRVPEKRTPLQAGGLLWTLRKNLDVVHARRYGPEVMCPVVEHKTPLHQAARAGDESILEELLDGDADVRAVDALDRTPLEIASTAAHEGAVRMLLRRRRYTDDEELSRSLIFVGSVETAKVILQETGLNSSGAIVRDAVLYSSVKCTCSRLHAARILLDSGCSVNARDCGGISIIHSAVINGYTRLVKFLIMRGAKRNEMDSLRRTALHVAAGAGRVGILSTLLDAGWSPRMRDILKYTPYDYAKEHGHTACMELLEAAVRGFSGSVGPDEYEEEMDIANAFVQLGDMYIDVQDLVDRLSHERCKCHTRFALMHVIICAEGNNSVVGD